MKFSGATGGILRFPNTNQDIDDGNAFAEAWLKLDVELWRQGDTALKAFMLANYVGDSKPFAYNNTRKAGLGLSLSTRVTDNLELIFSARYDWFGERSTSIRRQGWRLAVDYYYYKYWAETDTKSVWGMTKRSNVLKSYGTLAYPGSLIKGDNNIVLTLGAEYSAEYQIPDTKLLFIPFVDAHFSWDKDGNNYNNKIIPAVGVKLRKPLKKGELFLGAKYEVDYRWVANTVDTGPMIFAGWYKGF
ncbi:hypothetical protein ACXYMO_09965 [Arenibacterium sp. CAU 1754]